MPTSVKCFEKYFLRVSYSSFDNLQNSCFLLVYMCQFSPTEEAAGSKRNKIFESLLSHPDQPGNYPFYRFTMQNSNRIQEQNRVYAEDSARQIAKRIADHFASAQQLIKTYTYFRTYAGQAGSYQPSCLPSWKNLLLRRHTIYGFERTELFFRRQYCKTTDREFYIKGIAGKSGITTIMKSRRLNKPILGIYGPVHYEGKIFGVLHGAYISDSFCAQCLKLPILACQAMFSCASQMARLLPLPCPEALWAMCLKR